MCYNILIKEREEKPMKTITAEFAKKIIRERGILDTRTYRYVYDTTDGSYRRIRKEYLDTTAAYAEWQAVAVRDAQ